MFAGAFPQIGPDYRNVALRLMTESGPHSDKTSCAVDAPPRMTIGTASYRAADCLFSVDVEVIFIAVDVSGVGPVGDVFQRVRLHEVA